MGFLTGLAYTILTYTAVTAVLFLAASLASTQSKTQSTKGHAPGGGKLEQLLSFWARLLASVGALVLCASYGAAASVVLRIAGYGGLSQWTTARAFKYVMWLVTGVWFDVVNEGQAWAFGGKWGYQGEGGKESAEGAAWLSTRPAVFMGNHQTELDVLMLGTMFPKYCSVTAKRSLKWTPFLGQFMALSKTVFIDRGNRKSAVSAFDGAVKTMKSDKQSVYIFPEGTRSYATEPTLLPFKKGAFHLAIQAQVPIVPVVVANYSNVLNFKRKIFRSGRVPVKVLGPFETMGLKAEDVEGLMSKVREVMLKEIIAISKQEGTGLHTYGNGEAFSSGVERTQPIAAAS